MTSPKIFRRRRRSLLAAAAVAVAAVAATLTGPVLDAYADGQTVTDASTPPEHADYGSTLRLIESIAFPLYEDGTTVNPAARTGGGNMDLDRAGPSYVEARYRERRVAHAGNTAWTVQRNNGYADCGGFVATIVANMIDPRYPWILTSKQSAYLADPDNDWGKVGDTQHFAPEDYQLGDVFMTTGHTFLWLGDYQGHHNVIAQASYSPTIGSTTAHLPQIMEYTPRDPANGDYSDRRGREYDVYRYQGDGTAIRDAVARVEAASRGATDFDGDGRTDLLGLSDNGELLLYAGRAGNTFAAPKTIGSGFHNHQLITPGDFDNDLNDDVISVNTKTGIMHLHRGNGHGGFIEKKQIGSGFRGIRSLTGVGDFDGNGYPDIMGISAATGDLWLWRSNGAGGWLTKKVIGHGFQKLDIHKGGDFDGDGNPDLVSRVLTTGRLNVHLGDGNGDWRKKIVLTESGWADTLFGGIGDTDDNGLSEFIVGNANGTLTRYEGTATGTIVKKNTVGPHRTDLAQLF